MNPEIRKKLDLITSSEGISNIKDQESVKESEEQATMAVAFSAFMDSTILPVLKEYEEYLTTRDVPCKVNVSREFTGLTDDKKLNDAFGNRPPSYVIFIGEGGNWNHVEIKIILNSKHKDSPNNLMIELVTQYVCTSAHLSEEQAFELKRASITLIDRLSPNAKLDSIGYCQRDHQTMPINKLKCSQIEAELEKSIRWLCEIEFKKNQLVPGWREKIKNRKDSNLDNEIGSNSPT